MLLLRRAIGRAVEIVRYTPVRPRRRQFFHVVSAQRNMGRTALRCLQSVYDQRYPKDRVRHLFVDDASTDTTPDLVQAWLDDHPDHCVRLVRNAERRGMLANNLAAFRAADDDDIGIELNGDDWLPDPKVLGFFNKVYADDDVWMTYNTLRQTGGTIPFQLPPPRAVSRGGAYRTAPWMTSHLHTFRMRLHHRLPEEVFIDPETRAYWDLSQDMAVYLPMLELAGKHARHLHRITCIYNPHGASDHIRARADQLAAAERVRALPAQRRLSALADHDGQAP